MKPVQENNGTSTTNGCNSIISSNCITWQGNLPECINYCPEDSLTNVIESISQVICDALTISLYNTNLITQITNNQITSFYELVQNIIESIDIVKREIDDVEIPLPYIPPIITLPTCIYDECGSCTVNSFTIPDAFTVGFEIVCNMITDNISSLQTSIDYLILENNINNNSIQNLNTQITNINNRLNDFEDCITVTVGDHELTGPVSGEKVCANEAIDYLANELAITNELFHGGNKSLNTFYTSITEFSGEYSFANPSVLYLNTDGWVESPTNLINFTKNLYVLVKDIWTGLHICCDGGDPPCILIAPKNIEITSVTILQAVISWEAHGLTTVETETNYTVEVFAYNGVQAIGPVLLSNTGTLTSVALTTTSLVAGTDYVVRVTSNYSCGGASSEIIGELILCEEILFAHLRVAYIEDPAALCDSISYTKVTGPSWKIQLKNSGNIITNNTSGSPITVQIKVPVESPLVTGVLWEVYDFVIPHNSYEAEITTISPIYEKILIDTTCEEFRRGMNLIGGDVIEILNPETLCFVGVGVITYIDVT